MENRKSLPEIKMEKSTRSLFLQSLLGEFTEGGNRGVELLVDIGVFVLCALFSSTHSVFGVFPLGFALLAMCRARLLPVLLGCIVGSLGLGSAGVVYTLVYITMFFARAYMSAPIEKRRFLPICERYFSELLPLRFSLLLLVGLFLSVYELAVGGISSTSLLFSLGMMTLPSLCGIFISAVTESNIRYTDIFGMGEPRRTAYGKYSPLWVQVGILFVCVCITYAAGKISIFGLSLDYCFCTVATLFISRRFGALRASVLGSVCALTLDITLSPSFCALGLISGLLWQLGSFYAFAVGTAVAVGWAGYIGGVESFVAVAPEICVSSLLSLPLFSKLRSEPDTERMKSRKRSVTEQAIAVVSPTAKSDRISRLASAFSGISNIFYTTPDTRKPTASEYFALCEEICEQKCASCPKKSECWDSQERIAYRTVCKISDSLYADGAVKKGIVPTEMLNRCENFKGMLEDMISRSAELGLGRIKGDKTRFISYDYAMMSKLLMQSAGFERREYTRDESTEKALSAAARDITDEDLSIVTFGHRKKRIAVGFSRGDILKGISDSIHDSFERVCGCKLTQPEFYKTASAATMKMTTSKKLDIEYATASSPSGSGEISGDRAKCFTTQEELFYSVISDGMGTGETAASASTVAVSFLEKMLKAGAGKSLSLRMLNNVIRTKEAECSTTVDMLELDLIYGKTTFLKCGAAPSYVKRGEDIFVIKSRTSPIGLLRSTDAEKTDFAIMPGDIIVMLSDGVIQTEESDWLLSVLGSDMGDNLFAAANELVALAGKKTDNKDDTTVTLIRVKEAT